MDYKHRMLERMKEEVLQEAEDAAAENVRDTSPNVTTGRFRHENLHSLPVNVNRKLKRKPIAMFSQQEPDIPSQSVDSTVYETFKPTSQENSAEKSASTNLAVEPQKKGVKGATSNSQRNQWSNNFQPKSKVNPSKSAMSLKAGE
jgi:hypothetical protein